MWDSNSHTVNKFVSNEKTYKTDWNYKKITSKLESMDSKFFPNKSKSTNNLDVKIKIPRKFV